MPRTADPELPHRILKAADTLWQSGGEEAVTIRGVAAEAATTTPTVYSYYTDREALLTRCAQSHFSASRPTCKNHAISKTPALDISSSAPARFSLLSTPYSAPSRCA